MTNHQVNQPGLGSDFAPSEILSALPALYATEHQNTAEKTIVAKWFSPYSNFRWFAVEFDPETRNAFGYVQSDFSEWGYFNLDEMQATRIPMFRESLEGVERDCHWTPCTVAEAIERGDLEAKAAGIIDPEMDR